MKLPRNISGKRCARALGRLGFQPVRQTGSHPTVWNAKVRKLAVIPMHPALDVGTLLEILRQAGITRDEFLEAL